MGMHHHVVNSKISRQFLTTTIHQGNDMSLPLVSSYSLLRWRPPTEAGLPHLP
ncbi:hypothetical protein DL95DRAFT_44561 [Leptodontidium sp. 2 PMI_412]|nr:hypothetical protein DL95DRAFT_44561 [Leptodontidium sp. 2 PMI_412]